MTTRNALPCKRKRITLQCLSLLSFETYHCILPPVSILTMCSQRTIRGTVASLPLACSRYLPQGYAPSTVRLSLHSLPSCKGTLRFNRFTYGSTLLYVLKEPLGLTTHSLM
jgi:hypothetical protein